jgi:hypothetical protein
MFPNVWFAGWFFVPFISLALAVGGFYSLLYLIPRSKQDPNYRTDIFAIKASYWSIIVGLGCMIVWVFSAVATRLLVILKATQVIH